MLYYPGCDKIIHKQGVKYEVWAETMPSKKETERQAKRIRTDRLRERAQVEATRRAIQHEFIRELGEAGFSFRANATEPRGIQARVMRSVNKMYNGRTRLKTNRNQVSNWVARVRNNKYRATPVKQDYSQSSQNNRQFFEAEQKLIRDTVREQELKCSELASVWSTVENEEIAVSESTVRRYLKRPFKDEPSMVPARPNGFLVGGKTAHHRKCRRLEAEFWNGLSQDKIEGIWFADESKITFREHPNRQIDIKWVFRGEAGSANWYEKPKHPGQINLFLVMSIKGIELYDIYKHNMTLDQYKEMIPQIREEINKSDAPFSYFMHDNAWRDAQPKAELNEYIGRGKWTKYMGPPCWKPSTTRFTPIRKKPVREAKLRCSCTFPQGPIHAACGKLPKHVILSE